MDLSAVVVAQVAAEVLLDWPATLVILVILVILVTALVEQQEQVYLEEVLVVYGRP